MSWSKIRSVLSLTFGGHAREQECAFQEAFADISMLLDVLKMMVKNNLIAPQELQDRIQKTNPFLLEAAQDFVTHNSDPDAPKDEVLWLDYIPNALLKDIKTASNQSETRENFVVSFNKSKGTAFIPPYRELLKKDINLFITYDSNPADDKAHHALTKFEQARNGLHNACLDILDLKSNVLPLKFLAKIMTDAKNDENALQALQELRTREQFMVWINNQRLRMSETKYDNCMMAT